MLLEIGLRNFKAFGDKLQMAHLSKINLIYGPNSGGKTSLLQALLLLKQSRNDPYGINYSVREPISKLRPRGEYVDLGSFSALLHKHDLDRELEISLSYRGYGHTSEGRVVFVEPIQAAMRFSPNQVDAPSDIVGVKYRILHGDKKLLEGQWDSGTSSNGYVVTKSLSMMETEIPTELVDISHMGFLPYPYLAGFVPEGGVNWAEASSRNEVIELVRVLEEKSEPENLRLLRTLSSDRSYDAVFDSITYLGPLRSYPERVYSVTRRTRRSTGVRGEFMPDFLYATPATIDRVNEWFERFEIPYKLSVNTFGDPELAGEYVALALVDKHTNTKMTLADVGFGINQLLPVIVEGLAAPLPGRAFILRPYNTILCVEQPEIHLHPRLQAGIADLMIETSLVNRGKQWVVETHSELLIRRIQRRIGEGKLDPSDVSVIYVDPQGDEGSKIQMLRIDEDGEFIDDWPKGFFEEGYNELMAY